MLKKYILFFIFMIVLCSGAYADEVVGMLRAACLPSSNLILLENVNFSSVDINPDPTIGKAKIDLLLKEWQAAGFFNLSHSIFQCNLSGNLYSFILEDPSRPQYVRFNLSGVSKLTILRNNKKILDGVNFGGNPLPEKTVASITIHGAIPGERVRNVHICLYSNGESGLFGENDSDPLICHDFPDIPKDFTSFEK